MLLLGSGVFFNSIADSYYEDYKNSSNSVDANDARDKTEKNYQYRDVSINISIIPAIWSVYSWVKQVKYKNEVNN